MGGQMPRAPFPPNVTQWIRLVTCAFTVLDAISLSLSFSHSLSPRRPLSPQTARTLRVLRTPLPHWFLWELWGRSRRQRRAHIYTNLLKVFPNFCLVELTLRGYKHVGKEAKTGNLYFFISSPFGTRRSASRGLR